MTFSLNKILKKLTLTLVNLWVRDIIAFMGKRLDLEKQLKQALIASGMTGAEVALILTPSSLAMI